MAGAAFLALALAVAIAIGGCGGSPPVASPPGSIATPGAGGATQTASPSGVASDGVLTIFAAASLREPFEEIGAVFEAAHPETPVVFSFDASSALGAQIEQGAPADVFASADEANVDALSDAKLTAGPPVAFAGNLLTVVVPSGNPAGIRSPMDLARPGVRVIAAGEEVPISRYAAQALERMSALEGYGAGYAASVQANVVSREDNVRAVLAKIELGEGDAAIVYVTDARASNSVEQLEIPATANVPATYAAAALRASEDPAAAAAFLELLLDAEGQAILGSFGFVPAD